MLELKNIKKIYNVGGTETRALNGVSLAFRQKEFVAVLGLSGSGKTTLLNIIGGLDRADEGELVIKGKKTANFRDSDWDAYRNNSIGFVFQTYNLIPHLGIVDNVEIGMTLSGVPGGEKRRRTLDVLEQVGLKEHLHKKPNQLSGGQMQRVAIARALANDPEILLCDEPTGALDTATSVQIMELIRGVAQDRLVIMVTHNQALADRYADRIIRVEDGRILSDSNPYVPEENSGQFQLKKTSMNFFTALKLSFQNIRTKKGRTFLTSFASSIGIIGIAVILSLSTGFQTTIDEFQSDTMAEFPIIVQQSTLNINIEDISTLQNEVRAQRKGTEAYAETDAVYVYDPSQSMITHKNHLSEEYLEYLQAIDPEICNGIGYTRIVAMNLLREKDGKVAPASLGGGLAAMTGGGSGLSSSGGGMAGMSGMSGMGISSYPKVLAEGETGYLEKNYDVLAGALPTQATDLVLVVDQRNRVRMSILADLGFDVEDVERVPFDEILGTEFLLVGNDDFYVKTPFGSYLPNQDTEAMAASGDNVTLRITAVVRQKEDSMGLLATGIAYSDELSQLVIDRALDSEIVRAQRDSDRNVINMEPIEEAAKEQFIAYLGGSGTPNMVLIYPRNFEAKDEVIAYLDAYNEGRAAEDQVVYNDLAGLMSGMTRGIMDGITVVLISFAAISLVVSLIMISIITYTSVLERTKEIGILRSLGARKKDITRVFDAETTILGVFAGVMGVLIAWLLTFPINRIILQLTELPDVANLQWRHGLLLVVISTVLAVLGGHIPAKMASKKDAVEALRSE